MTIEVLDLHVHCPLWQGKEEAMVATQKAFPLHSALAGGKIVAVDTVDFPGHMGLECACTFSPLSAKPVRVLVYVELPNKT